MDALTNRPLFTASQWQCEDISNYKWSMIHCLTVTVCRWTLLQMEHYSLPHSDNAKMYAPTNEALFTVSQWQCGDGRAYKWTTIHCLTVTVQRYMYALTNEALFTASQWQCGDGRSYKWTTIHSLTVTVRRWKNLQMEHYLVPHNDSVEMDPLTNGPLFTASQWKCEDGRQYKWSTIHCLTMTVWRWTLLQMDHYSLPQWQCEDGRCYKWTLFTSSQGQCWDGGSYKWTAIHSFTVTVRDGHSYKWTTVCSLRVTVLRWTLLQMDRYLQPHSDSTKMDALTNGPLFAPSDWQCWDERSYKWTTIHFLTVTVWRWTLLQMDHYSMLHNNCAEMDALTNWPLFTVSHWECEDGITYKWRTIHCLTVTVWRWKFLQMEHYLLPHSDSVQMDAFTNETIFTTSQWESEDGRSCKWSTIHCLRMTVWRWTLLQMDRYSLPHSDSTKMDILTNGPLFTPSEWQCGDGHSYKWTTFHCLTVTVRRCTLLQMKHYLLPQSDSAEMNALTNGPLFTASQWESGIWTLLQMDHYSLPHSDSTKMDILTNGPLFTAWQWQGEDGGTYKCSNIHCLTVTVWRWKLLQMEQYSLPHSDSAKIDALTNEALLTASQWQCGDGRSYKWNTIHCLTMTV